MGLWSGKDFTKTNALDVIKARPPRQEPEFNYTQKPDFGRVPDYLVEEKKRQEAAMTRSAELKAQQAAEVSREFGDTSSCFAAFMHLHQDLLASEPLQ